MIKKVKLTKRLFTKLCGSKDAQAIMFNLTVAFAKENEPVMAKLGHHFKALYDEDLLEEAVILKEYAKLDTDSKEAAASKSFVDWLKEDDEEESSSEEESD